MLRPLLLTVFAMAGSAQTRPVVVELFTSEGCSSCPAADRVAIALERDGVIVLGEHVDYWDELGWKDRFSSPLFSSRQQEYGAAMKSGTVYTPQAVVNGQKEVLGSDFRALQRGITDAQKQPQVAISLQMPANDTIAIRIGKLPVGAHRADVLLAITESHLETGVGGGENAGRKLRHAPVVRTLSKLTEIEPATPGEYAAEARVNLRPEWVRTNLKLVLLVQDRTTRQIVGAAAIRP